MRLSIYSGIKKKELKTQIDFPASLSYINNSGILTGRSPAAGGINSAWLARGAGAPRSGIALKSSLIK
jgi:hypothetical protein